jgi:hypothetical protein
MDCRSVSRKVTRPGFVVSHQFQLDDAPKGYDLLFRNRGGRSCKFTVQNPFAPKLRALAIGTDSQEN